MKKLTFTLALLLAAAFFVTMICVAQRQETAKPTENKESPVAVSAEEVQSHRIGDIPLIRIKLKPEEQAQVGMGGIRLKITVDPNGAVVAISAAKDEDIPPNIPPGLQSQAEALAKNNKYQPFQRNGHAVWAKFDDWVRVLPPELKPLQHIPFPEIHNWKSVRITLQRTGCFGACPAYQVEIQGDGTVLYEGKAYVAVQGQHHGSISQETVHQIVDAFREADYYSLRDKYICEVTDNPAYETSMEIDGRLKKVMDYVGEEVGMPFAVSKLEESIDRLANTERWTKGNAATVGSLMEEKWDFKSPEAASTLVRVAQRGDAEAVRALVAAGVPLSGGNSKTVPVEVDNALSQAAFRGDSAMLRVLLEAGATTQDPQSKDKAISMAVRSRNVEAVRLLLDYGANPNLRDESGGTTLMEAASSGLPALVELFLKYHPDVNVRSNDGSTALMGAVGEWHSGAEPPEVNRAAVVRLLLAAGADPNARDQEGDTALIKAAWDADAALLLIKAGADVNAQNKQGTTPLINTPDLDVTRMLLENGANPSIRNAKGENALESAEQLGVPGKVEILKAALAGKK
ncbi:MAG TPA: ankyrin repeat domain-containing protein [Terriglobales bacterium]|jgi:ankyrin repeat protein|nr:ankyrin repeat domain-containing protein [Terriglobales bacterium]